MKHLTGMLIDRGGLASAGRCMVRISPGRIYATYHDQAPHGVSACDICDHVVIRGLGRWWERTP